MNTILTDDERRELRSEHGWALDTIKAIEAAVLAKLREPQEPVRRQCVVCDTVYEDGVPPQVAAPLPAVVQVPQGLIEKLAKAHDYSLDEDHIWCRDILRECIEALKDAAPKAPAGGLQFTIDQIHQALLDYGLMSDTEREDILAGLGSAPEAPAQGIPTKLPIPPAGADALDVVYAEGWNAACDAFFGGKPAPEPTVITVEAQAIPAPWREAVKVAREALQCNLAYGLQSCDDWVRDKADAALAQLDALEGGE